ncbi:hypothetical protein BDY19DRAFT_895006 [Irpex rosettiformis]|uniref:Uncharacterized protein n=1 Tax=Irpex rosettiformis TaxID=378272 RepID=A0ACB8TWD1_9APHY|nr:hypothetical protein BDY19DRAFT_895006 [Irpex rosettiformis]
MSSSTGPASRVLSPTSIASSFQYVTASDRHSEVHTSSDESFGSISDATSSDDDEIVWSMSDLSASGSSRPAAGALRSPGVLSDNEYIFLSPPLSQPQSGMSSLSASIIHPSAEASSSDTSSVRPTSQASSRRRKRRSGRSAGAPSSSNAAAPVATPKAKKKSKAKASTASASASASDAGKAKKKKAKAAKAKKGPSTTEEAGLGERPIVDDVSEAGDTKAAVYEEAVQYVSEILSASTPAEKAKSNLTFLQALIVELGLLSAPQTSQPFYQLPSLPRSLKAAKALLKSNVFLNVRDYLDVRHKGLDALRNVMHPSRKALIKDLSRGKGQRKVPRAYVKNSGLGVLLVACYH